MPTFRVSLLFARRLLRHLVLAWPAASVLAEDGFIGEYIWEEVSPGIFVHRTEDPLAAPVDGNSVVIVNDRDVFVVDTHINPAATRALVGKIRDVTDKPVTHIVNTHWHDDHVNGNYVLRDNWPDTQIISHQETLKTLREKWADEKRHRIEAYADNDLAALRKAADEAEPEDPHRATMLRTYAAYKEALEPELPSLDLVYPDTVFAERMTFRRGDRSIVLEWLGRGNTDGDVVVWLPEERVLITGDLLVSPIPFAFNSPMLEWIETLERLASKKPELIVPGHGAPQTSTDYLLQVQSLLRATMADVQAAREVGVEFEELAAAVDLSEFRAQFVDNHPDRAFAWESYYLRPGLKSAWTALGKDVVP